MVNNIEKMFEALLQDEEFFSISEPYGKDYVFFITITTDNLQGVSALSVDDSSIRRLLDKIGFAEAEPEMVSSTVAEILNVSTADFVERFIAGDAVFQYPRGSRGEKAKALPPGFSLRKLNFSRILNDMIN